MNQIILINPPVFKNRPHQPRRGHKVAEHEDKSDWQAKNQSTHLKTQASRMS